jgi:hypothetical protein
MASSKVYVETSVVTMGRVHVEAVCRQAGYAPPAICTPLELMAEQDPGSPTSGLVSIGVMATDAYCLDSDVLIWHLRASKRADSRHT